MKIGSAPVTARRSPAFFSSVEKYGEKKKIAISRFVVERVGELRSAVADRVEDVVLLSDLEQRPRIYLGDLLHAISVPRR